jgi:hypothetical protein
MKDNLCHGNVLPLPVRRIMSSNRHIIEIIVIDTMLWLDGTKICSVNFLWTLYRIKQRQKRKLTAAVRTTSGATRDPPQ